MPVYQIAAPILPGKLEQWRQFQSRLLPNGPQRAQWEEQLRRHGIQRQVVSLHETPQGPTVLVMLEGQNALGFFPQVARSQEPFDRWFVQQVQEIHGIDLGQIEGQPPSQVVLEATA